MTGGILWDSLFDGGDNSEDDTTSTHLSLLAMSRMINAWWSWMPDILVPTMLYKNVKSSSSRFWLCARLVYEFLKTLYSKQSSFKLPGMASGMIRPVFELTYEKWLDRIFNLENNNLEEKFHTELDEILSELMAISFEVLARRIIELGSDMNLYAVSKVLNVSYETVNAFVNTFLSVVTGDYHGDSYVREITDLVTEKGRSASIGLETNILKWWCLLRATYQVNFRFVKIADPASVLEMIGALLIEDRVEYTWNRMFSHGVFHFLIKRSWSVIFDRNIQTVLGFLAVMKVTSPRDKQVGEWIKLCPVLFILYFRIQCLREQREPIFSAVLDLVQHLHTCYVDRGTDEHRLGNLVVCSALDANNIKLNPYIQTYWRRFVILGASRDFLRHTDFDSIRGFSKLL